MKITRLLAVQRCGTNNSCPAVDLLMAAARSLRAEDVNE